jgi:hypothetical protein
VLCCGNSIRPNSRNGLASGISATSASGLLTPQYSP